MGNFQFGLAHVIYMCTEFHTATVQLSSYELLSIEIHHN